MGSWVAWVQGIATIAGIHEQREARKDQERQWKDMAKQNRAPPTIDDAAMQERERDRLRKRRGLLANIYGGASNSQPTVAKKQLTGSMGLLSGQSGGGTLG